MYLPSQLILPGKGQPGSLGRRRTLQSFHTAQTWTVNSASDFSVCPDSLLLRDSEGESTDPIRSYPIEIEIKNEGAGLKCGEIGFEV